MKIRLCRLGVHPERDVDEARLILEHIGDTCDVVSTNSTGVPGTPDHDIRDCQISLGGHYVIVYPDEYHIVGRGRRP